MDNNISCRIQGYVQSLLLHSEPKLEDFEPLDEVVLEKFRKPITSTYINFDQVGFEKSHSHFLSWIGSSEKEEEVEGYACRLFNASNVEIITKIYLDNLSEEDKKRYNDSKSPFLGLFEKKRVHDTAREGSTSYAQSNDIYGGLDADSYLSRTSDKNKPNIGNLI